MLETLTFSFAKQNFWNKNRWTFRRIWIIRFSVNLEREQINSFEMSSSLISKVESGVNPLHYSATAVRIFLHKTNFPQLQLWECKGEEHWLELCLWSLKVFPNIFFSLLFWWEHRCRRCDLNFPTRGLLYVKLQFNFIQEKCVSFILKLNIGRFAQYAECHYL